MRLLRPNALFPHLGVIAMRVHNTDVFKKYLQTQGFTHDHVIDVYTHPDGRWYHVGNDGYVRVINSMPHIEDDPVPQRPDR